MARFARIVIPDTPHLVTQRGNRRQDVFFKGSDYRLYKDLVGMACREAHVDVLAYCLMPNHVHLLLQPSTEDGLHRALGEAHRRYTRHVNMREGWKGFLWQGRFASYPLEEKHLGAAARYVELNPVRADLARRAKDWKWSSAQAHLLGEDDGFVSVDTLLKRFPDWRGFLKEGLSDKRLEAFRAHERTGRPLGSKKFLKQLEEITGRELRKKKPGPKPQAGPEKPSPPTV